MVKYICLNCDKRFLLKTDFVRHQNRKNPCKNTKNNTIDKTIKNVPINKELSCDHCSNIFSTKSNLTRHLDGHCKIKKDTEMQNALSKITEQMKQQQEEIESLKKNMASEKQNITNNTNNIIGNTINNNIQQNIIQVIPFGKEKLDLTDRQLVRFLRKCYNCVPELINFKHFNEKMPENCNVYIPNSKCSHARVYTGDQWEIRDTGDVIHQLFEDNNDYLIDKFKEKEEELDEMTKRKFSKYLSKQEDKKVISGVKRNIKHNLYNKKHIPLSINNEK